MADWKITTTILSLAVCSCIMDAVLAVENDWTDRCHSPCSCKWMSGRKMADCSKKDLKKLPTELSNEIQSLELSANPIAALMSDDFTRVGLANLQKIRMKDCRIKEVHKDAFRGLKILIELDLSGNQIHVVHVDTFRDNEKLRVLSLAGNPIEKLEDGLFSNHAFLQTIDLSDCDVSYIGQKTFTNISVLTKLRLDGNQLTHLKVTTFESLTKLNSLEIQNNPWICDCKLRSFRDWIIRSNLYTAPTSCKEPSYLTNSEWTSISSEQFACKPIVLTPSVSGSQIRVPTGNSVTLSCRVTGDPKPQTNWAYNSQIIDNNTSGGFFYSTDSSIGSKYTLHRDGSWLNLTINRFRVQDEGDYNCVANSVGGIDEKNYTLITKQFGGADLILRPDQMTGDVWLLLVCLLLGIICALVLLIVLCCICWRRNSNSSRRSNSVSIKKPFNNDVYSNGVVSRHPSNVAGFGDSDQRKTLLNINPVQKPPRKYGDSPTPIVSNDIVISSTTELTELNRNLLDDGSVIGSSSITGGESVDERRSSDSTDRLSSRQSQYTYLTPEKTRSESANIYHPPHHHHNYHHPPDLLAFSNDRNPVSSSTTGVAYNSNDFKLFNNNNNNKNVTGSPLHSPTAYSSSYGTLPYNLGTLTAPIISQRQGYVTIPRRPRVPSWSSAPTPTLLEGSATATSLLAKAEPVYDNLGPRTTIDGSSVLSLPRKLSGELSSNVRNLTMKHRPLPHKPITSYSGSSTLPHNSKLLQADNFPNSYTPSIDNNNISNSNNIVDENASGHTSSGVIKPLPLNESQILPSPTSSTSPTFVSLHKNDKRRSSWSSNNNPNHNKGIPETGILKRPSAITGVGNNYSTISMVKPKVPPRPPPKPKKNGPLFEDECEDGTEV